MDMIALIKSLGYIGIWGIIFAESGVLFAVMLPGDSLLIASGFLAAHGKLDFWPVVIGCFVASVLGNLLGYEIGKRVGLKALEREEDGRFFKKAYIAKTNGFFCKYGRSTIILGRFLPVVRTFAPFLAGVVQMNYKIFVLYSLIGGFFWTVGLCSLGHFLGRTIRFSEFDDYLTWIVTAIILILLCPTGYHLYKFYRKSARAKGQG